MGYPGIYNMSFINVSSTFIILYFHIVYCTFYLYFYIVYNVYEVVLPNKFNQSIIFSDLQYCVSLNHLQSFIS